MKLSYGDVLKELNYAFYVEGKKLTYLSIKKSSDDKIKQNPMFTQIVIIDTNAAHLQNKIKSIDATGTNELVNGISLGLSELGNSKETVVFQETYASESRPLLEKAKEELLQKEEMEVQVVKHIKQIHQEIPTMVAEIKAGLNS